MNLEAAFTEISKALDSFDEWLLTHSSGSSFALRGEEIEIAFEREKILFGFLYDKGFRVWRVADYRIENEKLTLDLTRSFGRVRERIKLVPRQTAAQLSAAIEAARLERANEIACLLVAEVPDSKLIRVSLGKEKGRFAHIIFDDARRTRIAALADVSERAASETILATAVLRLAKLEARRDNKIEKIWILAEKKSYKTLTKLHALLRGDWKSKIAVKKIGRRGAHARRKEIFSELPIALENLWREKPPAISAPENFQTSRTASEIVNLASQKIDCVFTRRGETLRFLGLPFARVRTTNETERAWFGVERERQVLSDATRAEFFALLENLETHRRHDSANRRHALYTLAPEAWLESILRRDIKLLDNNLILSPIHNQFRADGDRIDLLALRRDGRLVLVELKVAPDREMIFQAADYWRKIELQRRSGNLQRERVFGDLEIADQPTIVFLAAPTLSFHRDFEFLSGVVSPEIEIYRFDLNENWREDLKVMKVERVESKR